MCIGTRLPTVSTALYNISIIIIIIFIFIKCHRVLPLSQSPFDGHITLCETTTFILKRNARMWELVSD